MVQHNDFHLPSANLNIHLDAKTNVPQINIRNYNKLLSISKMVSQNASKLASDKTASRKQLRARRRNINKLKKAIRDLKKYYEKGYKKFNNQVLALTKTLGLGSSAVSKTLKKFQEKDKEVLADKLKPTMHTLCQNAMPPIPDQPIPKDCLKKSMSKTNRLKLMRIAVNQGEKETIQYIYWKRLHVAIIKNNKAIDPDTKHAIKNTSASTFTLIGHPKDISKLCAMAKSLHVCLRKNV